MIWLLQMDTYIAETGVCLPTTLNTVPAVLTLLHFRILLVFTFTNIFGFFSWTEFGPSILGVQYTLIDFLSRENSSVNSCKKRVKKW